MQNSPKALWHKGEASLAEDSLIKNTLSGYRIKSKDYKPDKTSEMEVETLLFDVTTFKQPTSWATPEVPSSDNFGSWNSIKDNTIKNTESKRKDLATTLQGLGFDIDPKAINITDNYALDLFDEPDLCLLGEEKI